MCPSEYILNLCALDAENNAIKIWNIGSGKVISETKELDYDFRGFKHHS